MQRKGWDDLELQAQLAQFNQPLVNRVKLAGIVQAIEPQRFTAAGMPAQRLTVVHLSEQAAATTARRVQCELAVQLLGEALCAVAKTLSVGDGIEVDGFLTRNAYKRELSWVIVEATQINKLTVVQPQ